MTIKDRYYTGWVGLAFIIILTFLILVAAFLLGASYGLSHGYNKGILQGYEDGYHAAGAVTLKDKDNNGKKWCDAFKCDLKNLVH